MNKIQRLYASAISIVADAIGGLTSQPSWGYVPELAYKRFMCGLLPKKFGQVDGYVSLSTDDGLVFLGPEAQEKFVCGRRSRERARRALTSIMGKQPYTEAQAALAHNLTMRIMTEFSSYPYNAARTRNLRPGDLFVDIGAFRGYVSLKAALRVGRDGKVLAIEPIEENLSYIERHKQINGINNMDVLHASVSIDDSATISFYKTENQRNSQILDHLEGNAERVDMPNISTKRLASLILETGKQRVIVSLTTNGTELSILESLYETLRSDIEYLEITAPLIYAQEEVEDFRARLFCDSHLSVSYEHPWVKVIYARQ